MDPQAPDERLTRENTYLRQRNSQLQEDLVAVTAEAGRLREQTERLHGRTGLRQADPLSGGQ